MTEAEFGYMNWRDLFIDKIATQSQNTIAEEMVMVQHA